ncbi:MAG: 50S ribosomal protein L7Ae [Candidatus Njordarchaeales archaeon]
MSSPPYITWETPDSLADEAIRLLDEIMRSNGKVKRGVNETTKSVERGSAKLVYIARDVNPPEIVMHLPHLCEEKGIPYLFVPSKKELGKAAGIERPASSVAVVDAGEAMSRLERIIQMIKEFRLTKK